MDKEPPEYPDANDNTVTVWEGDQQYLARHEETGLTGEGDTEDEAISALLDKLNESNREPKDTEPSEPKNP